MRIIFMGTPSIAAQCLSYLNNNNLNIITVVSQPDKPKGRKMALHPPEAKVEALAHDIPVLQPEKIDEDFIQTLADLAPDLIVVVAYGRILPQSVLDLPTYGCINLHTSLLPKYRGAAPMQRAIMAGEAETGVTVQRIVQQIDAGDIIATEAIPITPQDDLGSIHQKMCDLGGPLLADVITKIADGSATYTPQNHEMATHAAKITKSDCLIDFSNSAKDIVNQIRGLSPSPLAYTTHRGRILKIVSAKLAETGISAAPGQVISTEGNTLSIACGSGVIEVDSLVPEGRGRMSAADFLRGRGVEVGEILGI